MSHIKISQATNAEEWEKFLLSQPDAPFMQSWSAIAWHNKLGQKTIPLLIHEDSSIIGLALVVEVRARRGSYFFLPYGPVFKKNYWPALKDLTSHLIHLAKKHKFDFIRSSPFIENQAEYKQHYAQNGWLRAPIHLLAENIWLLDITPSPDELLKGMRKTMRNLIRRALRASITISIGNSPEECETFISLHRQTVQRHNFTPYADELFRAEVTSFRPRNQVQVVIAQYNKQPIAAAIAVFYGNTVSYHHGASSSKYEKIPASYLLQWQTILEAKKLGYKKYNFWGIVPESTYVSPILKRVHPMKGLSEFKKGFGGYQYNLLHCQDLPLTPRYRLNKAIETLRRLKRGYFIYT